MESFLVAARTRRADFAQTRADDVQATDTHATDGVATSALDAAWTDPLSRLDDELLSLLVGFVDTRFHGDSSTSPIAPLSVVALGCLNHTILAKLREVRPAIRMGTYGQAKSGALNRRDSPGIVQTVEAALAFERRGIWRIGQLSSLSYSSLRSPAGLERCRGLHTLQLSQCNGLVDLLELGRCPALETLFVVNCRLLHDLGGLRGSRSIRFLELSGCTMLESVEPLAGVPRLTQLSLAGSHGIADVSPLGACAELARLDLVGLCHVTDVSALRRCEALRQLDLRGTGYLQTRAPLPHLPQVSALSGPGWQDVGVRGRVLD